MNEASEMNTDTIEDLLMVDSQTAWERIRSHLKDNVCGPITGSVVKEIARREKRCEPLELALSGAAWTLWKDYFEVVPLASQQLLNWWGTGHGGKAALILDGFSIREAPIIAAEAEKRGFSLSPIELYGSQLPAETNAFAKALGFSHRGALDNNGAGSAHKMTDAYTLSNDLPWKDVSHLLPAEPKLLVWHHWPDHRIHDYSDQGEGIRRLLPEIIEQLESDDFWSLIEKLATGREVVITADHGYAHAGSFRDADNEEKAFFRENFGANRSRQGELSSQEWLPPLALTLDCPTGRYSMSLGRTKWSVPGGHKTLSHGGLTLFETIVPFMRLTKN